MTGRGGRGGGGGGGRGGRGGGGQGGRGSRGRGGRAGDVDLPAGVQQSEEQPLQVTQPPPNFPPIEHKAPKLQITDEWPYLFELKRDYAESLFESRHNVDVNKKKDIDRWSDRLAAEMVTRSRYDKFCDWTVMPVELKPRGEKRKGKTATNRSKKNKEVDVLAKLAKLEEAEEKTDKDPDDLEEEEKSSDEEENEDKDPEEDLEEDEEMDEGTDYANNYFKNGEEDEEEDDVYEEGGVF
ncbi:RNA polymerase III subunit G [Cotesia typhae]|uniref:RNA polymerase III subunit G n=1 Tax=Cotesia typhae TaxID=2053667 RepID=UPI003D699971